MNKVKTSTNKTVKMNNTLDKLTAKVEDIVTTTNILEVDITNLSPKEKIAHFKAMKLDKASKIRVTNSKNMFDLRPLDFAYKYEVLSHIYNAGLKDEAITFFEIHDKMPMYDIKGLSRDVNTKYDKVLRSVKLNEQNGNFDAIADVYCIWKLNIDIQNILGQTKNIAKCFDDKTQTYDKTQMEIHSITPRDISRNKAINEVINEFGFDEIVVDFQTEENVERSIRSLGKGNDVVTYKHNNSIQMLFGFELLKVYLETYGANETHFAQ